MSFKVVHSNTENANLEFVNPKCVTYTQPIPLSLIDVPVWKVTPEVIDTLVDREMFFNLKVDINAAGGNVKGHDLWKVGAWSSARADGEGERISYTKQVKDFKGPTAILT